MRKILIRLGGLLLLLFLGLLGGLYFYLQSSLPMIDGEVILDGPEATIKTRNGASFRAIYDLSDLDNSRFVIPTGQSGNPASPYYDQLTDLWAEGRYIRIPTKIDQVRANTQAQLVLKPTPRR